MLKRELKSNQLELMTQLVIIYSTNHKRAYVIFLLFLPQNSSTPMKTVTARTNTMITLSTTISIRDASVEDSSRFE